MERGYKGKGILNHGICDGNGRLLRLSQTPANGDERAQVLPLLDTILLEDDDGEIRLLNIQNLAGDKGYDSNPLREQLRQRKTRPEIAKRNRKGGRKPKGRPFKIKVPRFIIERAWAWLQRKFRRIVVRWERRATYFQSFLDLALIWMWTNWILEDQKQEVLG